MAGQNKGSVGIPSCVTDGGDGPYGAALIERDPRPFDRDIGCAKCGVRVVAVKEHKVGSRLRRAHFRLGNAMQHEEGCAYDYDRHAKRVADEHHAVVATKGDVCVLRLTVEPRSGPTRTRPAPAGQKRVPLKVTSNRSYGTVQQTVQAAAAIAKLLRTFEHDQAALEHWQGTYNGETIPWDAFHYHADEDYERLAERLHAGKPAHPLAVSGRIRKVTERDGVTSIHLDTKPGARTPDGSFFNVLLRVPTPDAPGYSVGDDILAYGMWELWKPSGRDDGRTPTTYAVTRLANASHSTLLAAPAHDS